MSAYANHLNTEDMRFRNLMFNGKVLIPKEKIRDIYYQFNENYNLRNRLSATREALLKILNRKVHVEMKKKWVEEAVQNLSREEIMQMHQDGGEEILNADKEFNFLARRIVIKAFRRVQRQIVRNHFLSINNQFVHMLRSVPQILALDQYGIDSDTWKQDIEATIGRLKEGRLSLADATAYIYLYDLMTGKRGEKDIRYLFIDEVQDYSAFQLAFLKFSFPRAKFTLLGDLNQAIFTHENSRKLLGELSNMFPADKTRVVQLTKSYRSTEQITNFTKHILTNGEEIVPFNRQGELPKISIAAGIDDAVERVKTQAEENLAEHETTAIIGKTLKECRQLSGKLAEVGVRSTLIRTENQRLVKGIIIVPSYLAKGLEFDSVIMWDASRACYPDERDRQLVYTICTRAMHRLTIVANKKLSPIFETVPKQEYQLA